MLDSLVSIYAPHLCIGCEAEGSLICKSCQQIMRPAVGRCYRCRTLSAFGQTCHSCRRASSLFGVRSVTTYDGLAKDLVYQLKFNGSRAAAATIAELLNSQQLSDDCIIVHVPTATGRIRLRGYDQAQLVAKRLAALSGKRYVPALLRTGQHRQVGASRVDRLQHMKDAFIVKSANKLQGSTILLVDDVMTTGATLESAAAALKAAGARRVEAVVFARA